MSNKFTKTDVKTSFFLIIIILLEKIFSFIKNIIFAYYFGADNNTDSYYLATNIVSLFNVCFCSSIPMAFLTVFINKGYRNNSIESQSDIISKIISAFSLIALGFTLILYFIAPIFSHLLSLYSNENSYASLDLYIQIMAFMVIFYCFSGMFSSALECIGNYIPSKLSSFFISFSTVLSALFFGEKYGVVVAIYGTLCGIALHALYSYVVLRKQRKIIFKSFVFSQDVKKILFICFPMILSTAITSINSLVDKLIASGISEGAISSLNYSSLLSRELISGVFISAIGSIIMARFSENILNKDLEALQNNMQVAIYTMLYIIIPINIVYYTCASDIIKTVFFHGAFQIEAAYLTTSAFIGYSVGISFIPIREVLIRVQYAFQDSKTPMMNAVVSVIFNIVFSFIFVKFMGIKGVALATSISIVFNSLLTVISLQKVNKFNFSLKWNIVIRLLSISLLTLIVSKFIASYISISSVINIFITYLTVNLVFFTLLYFLCKDQLLEISKNLKWSN